MSNAKTTTTTNANTKKTPAKAAKKAPAKAPKKAPTTTTAPAPDPNVMTPAKGGTGYSISKVFNPATAPTMAISTGFSTLTKVLTNYVSYLNGLQANSATALEQLQTVQGLQAPAIQGKLTADQLQQLVSIAGLVMYSSSAHTKRRTTALLQAVGAIPAQQ